MPGDIMVAILTGGQSSRMGRDKALLPWGEGQIIDRMLAVASEVTGSSGTLIVGDRPEYHGRGARVLADLYPGAGPLGGIATALEAAGAARVLVLAVDMPHASPTLLNAMVEYPTSADMLVPEARDPRSGAVRLQVLHAIYGTACLSPARKRLSQHERRVTAIVEDVTVERLGEPWLRDHDPELRSFENINLPEQYERARAGHEGSGRE